MGDVPSSLKKMEGLNDGIDHDCRRTCQRIATTFMKRQNKYEGDGSGNNCLTALCELPESMFSNVR